MKYNDMPREIKADYNSDQVSHARIYTSRGENQYSVFLTTGKEDIWKFSCKKNCFYKVKHKG